MAYDNNSYVEGPFWAFLDFLKSDVFMAYRFGAASNAPPTCVLDVVEMWVVLGDATKVCPTFESFAITVLNMVERWLDDTERMAIYGIALWPDELGNDGCGLVFDRFVHDGPAILHPALNKTMWEMVRSSADNTKRVFEQDYIDSWLRQLDTQN